MSSQVSGEVVELSRDEKELLESIGELQRQLESAESPGGVTDSEEVISMTYSRSGVEVRCNFSTAVSNWLEKPSCDSAREEVLKCSLKVAERVASLLQAKGASAAMEGGGKPDFYKTGDLRKMGKEKNQIDHIVELQVLKKVLNTMHYAGKGMDKAAVEAVVAEFNKIQNLQDLSPEENNEKRTAVGRALKVEIGDADEITEREKGYVTSVYMRWKGVMSPIVSDDFSVFVVEMDREMQEWRDAGFLAEEDRGDVEEPTV